MKRTLALGLLMATNIAMAIPAYAQSDMVDGQVIRINEPESKITLRHGPIKKFDMDDGMTMVFRVRDPAMLKQVKVGDKVKFEADKINGQFTVIRMQKAR